MKEPIRRKVSRGWSHNSFVCRRTQVVSRLVHDRPLNGCECGAKFWTNHRAYQFKTKAILWDISRTFDIWLNIWGKCDFRLQCIVYKVRFLALAFQKNESCWRTFILAHTNSISTIWVNIDNKWWHYCFSCVTCVCFHFGFVYYTFPFLVCCLILFCFVLCVFLIFTKIYFCKGKWRTLTTTKPISFYGELVFLIQWSCSST